MKGHNNPPAETAFALEVDDLFTLLSDTLAGGTVTSDAQEEAIDGLLDDFRRVAKDAEAARKEAAKPFDDGKKAVQAAFKPVLDKADKGVAACKDALTPYRQAKQRAVEEAARKAREEAEAKQRAAQEALRQSEDLESRFAAEEQLKAADKLTKSANHIERGPTGLRTYQIADVTDRRALLEHVMRNDPEALTDWLAEYARKSLPACLPGVTIRIEQRAA